MSDAGTILGVDYGTVRIGLAVGDPRTGLVLPLSVLPNPGSVELAIEAIADVARNREAAEVVLGNPVHVSGDASAMSNTVARVADGLREKLGETVSVLLRDERYSSVSAEDALAASGLKWWQYPKGQLDTMAAMSLVRELMIERDPSRGTMASEAEAPPPAVTRREKDERRRKHQKKGRRRDEGE